MNLKNQQNANVQPNVVLLIDAENIHSKFADKIISYISKLGNVVLKRIYGDWQCDCIKSWREPALFYNITPYQQFSITNSQNKTKNSTDIALIIDAMTFLYEKDIDIFCIVSSDSDFYTLVRTLREKNKKVIGFGGVQVNENYKNSFDTFITLQDDKSSKTKNKVQIDAAAVANKKLKLKVQKMLSPQKKTDTFLKENTPLSQKIKVYILSVLDRNTKDGQMCNGQILFDKLVEHKEYKEGIQVDSYKLFLGYLQNILNNTKYTMHIQNERAFISKK